MALPTRVSREQQQQHVPMIHPIELMHREFDDLLSRFFGGGGVFGPSATAGALPAGVLSAALGATGYGVDVREDDQHVYIDADLPGFRKEDIDISIDGKTLTIAAEHKEEIEEPAPQPQAAQPGQQQQQGQQQAQQAAGQASQQRQVQPGQVQRQPQQQVARRAAGQQQQQQKGQYLLRERRYEQFTRSFTLPEDVDTQNVQAKLENGVLEITLNKTPQSKRTKVQVS